MVFISRLFWKKTKIDEIQFNAWMNIDANENSAQVFASKFPFIKCSSICVGIAL